MNLQDLYRRITVDGGSNQTTTNEAITWSIKDDDDDSDEKQPEIGSEDEDQSSTSKSKPAKEQRAKRGKGDTSQQKIAELLNKRGIKVTGPTIHNYKKNFMDDNPEFIKSELERLGLPDNPANRNMIGMRLALRAKGQEIRQIQRRGEDGEYDRSYERIVRSYKIPGKEETEEELKRRVSQSFDEVAAILEKSYGDIEPRIRFIKAFFEFVKDTAGRMHQKRLSQAETSKQRDMIREIGPAIDEEGISAIFSEFFKIYANIVPKRAAEYIGSIVWQLVEYVASEGKVPVGFLSGSLKGDIERILRWYMLDIDPDVEKKVSARVKKFLGDLDLENTSPEYSAQYTKALEKWKKEHPNEVGPDEEPGPGETAFAGTHGVWKRRLNRYQNVATKLDKLLTTVSEEDRRKRIRDLQWKVVRRITSLKRDAERGVHMPGNMINTLIEDLRVIIKRQIYRSYTFPVIMSSMGSKMVDDFAKKIGIKPAEAYLRFEKQSRQIALGKMGTDALQDDEWDPDAFDPEDYLRKSVKHQDDDEEDGAAPILAPDPSSDEAQDKFLKTMEKETPSSDAMADFLKKNYGILLTGFAKDIDTPLIKLAGALEKMKKMQQQSGWKTKIHPDKVAAWGKPEENYVNLRKYIVKKANVLLNNIDQYMEKSDGKVLQVLKKNFDKIQNDILKKEFRTRRGEQIAEAQTLQHVCTSQFASWFKLNG